MNFTNNLYNFVPAFPPQLAQENMKMPNNISHHTDSVPRVFGYPMIIPNNNSYQQFPFLNHQFPYQNQPAPYSNQHFPYPYRNQQNSEIIHNGMVIYPTKPIELPPVVKKRVPTPLTITNPDDKKAIDLANVLKASKLSCLTDETTSEPSNVVEVAYVEGQEIILNNKDGIVLFHNDFPYEDGKQSQLSVITGELNCNIENVISSNSIDNNLVNLSHSVNQLYNSTHDKSKSTYHEAVSNKYRYSREALLEIRNTPLCRKPTFNCSEIEFNDITSKIVSNDILICSENGYKPPNMRLKENSSQINYLETNRRQFKSILNKVAPQNFDKCFDEIITMIANHDGSECSIEEFMTSLITEIFLKAVQEEAYSVTYADLCTQINKYEFENKKKWCFNQQLSNRCKTMFKTPLQDQLKSVREHWEKKIENETDDKLKCLYISEVEEQVKKEKDKFFGNIRFIGELYLHNLLTGANIDICVNELLSKRNDEDAILSLCKLLKTCGKKLDSVSNDKMIQYVTAMQEIVNSDKLPKRMKFSLSEIIDMRQRNWTLRESQIQKLIQPKTLDQVKQDMIDEKRMKDSKLSNNSQNRTWTSNNKSDIKFKKTNKTSSLGITSIQRENNEYFDLKPRIQKWRCGSNSNEDEWHESKRIVYNSSSKNTHSKEKSNLISAGDKPPQKICIGSRFSLLHEHGIDNNIDIVTQEQMITNESKTSSTSSSAGLEQSANNLDLESVEILDAEDIFSRFLDTGLLDVPSWCQLSDISKTLVSWIDGSMEKSRATRNILGDQLANLMTIGKLSTDDLVDSIKTFLESIDDLKTDIPLIWTFLAEFLERLIVNSESDISFVKVIIESQYPQMDISNCVLLCLKYTDDRLGHSEIGRLLENSVWALTYLSTIDLEFMASMGLGFLFEFIIDQQYFDKFRTAFSMLLPCDHEELYQFLVENFHSDMIKTKQCVYFVSGCVFSYLSHLSECEIPEFFRDKRLFFILLLDRRPNFERELLQALDDNIVISSNKGLLTTVIQSLMDSIVSFDAFLQFIELDESEQSVTINNTENKHTVAVIKLLLSPP